MLDLIHKIEIKVNPNFKMPCYLWTGRTNKKGYGRIDRKNKTLSTHRYAWMSVNGPIPKGLFVLHKCDIPNCINPDHLFLGTHQDNMDDMKVKGRATNANKDKTHCKHGHELNNDNTVVYVNSFYNKNMRQCLKCRVEKSKRKNG